VSKKYAAGGRKPPIRAAGTERRPPLAFLGVTDVIEVESGAPDQTQQDFAGKPLISGRADVELGRHTAAA
jgi:hypothetical protein